MVSRIFTFMVKKLLFMVSHLLHLWLIFIAFMVSITFMVDFHHIYGEYIYGCYYIYG